MKIHDQVLSQEHVPVASVAPNTAATTPGVTVAFDYSQHHCNDPSAGDLPHDDIQGGETHVEEEVGVWLAPLPPLWNAWWCGGCCTLHYVDNGGDLLGACVECGDSRPVRNDVMLDPNQVEQLKAMPGLTYDATLLGNTGPPPSLSLKMSGMMDDGLLASSPESMKSSEIDFLSNKTDLKVSTKFSFFERLHHYMEHCPISKDNHRAEEVAIMVEAGSIVRELGMMTKGSREKSYHLEYLALIFPVTASKTNVYVRI